MDKENKNKKPLADSKLDKNEAKAKSPEDNKENENQEESRNGVIPEDMDFRKFIGCGG